VPSGLSCRHEGLKDIVSNFLRNAGAIVRHRNLDVTVGANSHNPNSAGLGRDRFAGISEKVAEDSTELCKVEPTLSGAFMQESELYLPELGLYLH
jgi:hypothetical protein